jgi:rhomboid protease GluP
MKKGHDDIDAPSQQIKMKSIGSKIFTVENLLISSNLIIFLEIRKYPYLAEKYMKSNRMITRGQKYRLLSAVFAHKTVDHFAFNMLSLSSLGEAGTIIFGPLRFLILYLIGGIGANVFTYMLKTSPISLGASGSIFSIVGAIAMVFCMNRNIIGKAESNAVLSSTGKTVIMNLIYGYFIAKNIDNMAHIGGFLCGALFTLLFGPLYRLTK